MLKALNNFIALFVDSFMLFGRVKAWMLLLVIFCVNYLVLFSHTYFYEFSISSLIIDWVNILNTQYAVAFTHYPGHYILLPYFYGITKLLTGALFEGAILGFVAVIFYRYIIRQNTPTKYTISSFISLWVQLAVGWIIINGLITGGHYLLPKLLEPILHGSPRREMIFEYFLMPGYDIVIFALLFFAIPFTAIYRVNIFNGLMNSVKIFFTRPVFCLFLAAVIMSLPILLGLLLNQPYFIVTKFRPEMIFWILLLSIGTDIFVNFFWMSTSVGYLSDLE